MTTRNITKRPECHTCGRAAPFGDRDTGAYLPKPAWTDIARHTLVKGGASPDDPDLAEYWAQRRRKVKPPLDPYTVRLLSKQDGRCTLCGENLLIPDQPPQSPEGWERWFLWVTKKAIKADHLVHHTAPNTPRADRTHLVHATCGRTGKRTRAVTLLVNSIRLPGRVRGG